jgi:short-subunit dehydrogenase
MSKKYALITGAYSGLGKAFALHCAKRGFNLILLDIPGSATSSIASHLAFKYKVEAHVFEFDLTNTYEARHQLNTISEKFPVSFIINNAGIGGTSSITETSIERIEQIISLNIKSTVMLTRIFIPHLLKQADSYILNVSSMAAFTPIAFKNVYPASKAFISSFSLGLRQELSGTNVSVSVLYPGSIMTNFSVAKRIMSLGALGRMGLLSTDEIAAIAIRKTFSKKAIIIPGMANRINYLLMSLLPVEFKLRIVSREIKKETRVVPSF